VPRNSTPDVAGGYFHVTARGIRQLPIFLDHWDYAAWLRILERTIEAFEWRCYAYCAMPNHIHLVLKTPKPTRGAGMRHLNGSYAQRFNARHDAIGHVFEARYGAKPIDDDPHLKECARYAVLNPVRAGLCRRPEAWRWSSYRATAGIVPAPHWLATEELLDMFVAPTDERRGVYRAFVDSGLAMSGPVRGPGPETRLRHASRS
jgi:REP-associated tyrosine transposase